MTKQITFTTQRGAAIIVSLAPNGLLTISANGGEGKSFDRINHTQGGAALTFDAGIIGNKAQRPIVPIPSDKIAAVDALIAEGREILRNSITAAEKFSTAMEARMYANNSRH